MKNAYQSSLSDLHTLCSSNQRLPTSPHKQNRLACKPSVNLPLVLLDSTCACKSSMNLPLVLLHSTCSPLPPHHHCKLSCPATGCCCIHIRRCRRLHQRHGCVWPHCHSCHRSGGGLLRARHCLHLYHAHHTHHHRGACWVCTVPGERQQRPLGSAALHLGPGPGCCLLSPLWPGCVSVQS